MTILDGTTKIGTATVASNGGWSANVTLSNQGSNVITATDTNVAGTGTSNAVTYTLHSVAPTVKITSTGVTTSSAAQTITGTVDVADAGSIVTILDGTTKIGTATVASNGGWSANVTLSSQGSNVVTATDTNVAGTGTSNAVTYTLHSGVPPTVAIASTGVTTSSAAQTITGTVDVADAGSIVTILDGTTKIGTATVAANGSWAAKVTLLNQGSNVVTATDTNASGTGTSNAVTYTLHSVAPTVKITSTGAKTRSAAQTITGTVDVADAGSTVTILDGTTKVGTATVASNGAWSSKVTLSKGSNVITATDTNAAGTGTSNAVTYTLLSGLIVGGAGGAKRLAASATASTLSVTPASTAVSSQLSAVSTSNGLDATQSLAGLDAAGWIQLLNNVGGGSQGAQIWDARSTNMYPLVAANAFLSDVNKAHSGLL